MKTAAANAQSAADAAMAAAKAAQTSADAAQSAADKAQKAAEAAAEAGKAAAAQAKVEAINEAIAQVNEILKGYATKEDLAAAASRIAAIEDGLNKTNTAVDELKKAQAQMQIQLDALKKYEEFGTQIGLMQKDIDAVKGDIVTINAALKNCVTAEQMNKAIDEVSKSLATKNANLITLLTKQLRSLVFIPNFYVDGIEAAAYNYLSYNAMVNGNAPATGTTEGQSYKIDTPKEVWDWAAGDKTNYVNPTNEVAYELNPSSAEVEVKNVTMIGKEVQTLTRAAGAVDPKAVSVKKENGNLIVGYTLNAQNLPTSKESAYIMATQVENYNTDESEVGNVTSDYAMIYGLPANALAIAYKNSPQENGDYKTNDCVNGLVGNHLWETANLAIENAPTITIAWNDVEGINIAERINLHVAKSTVSADKELKYVAMSLDEASAEYGFTYTYTAIDYLVGSNQTSDTKFANPLNGGSVVKPCGVTSDGQPSLKINKNSVGRKPLYMVQVKAGSEVVLVGFVKFNIVEPEVAPEKPEPVVTEPFDLGQLQYGCDAQTKKITWSEVNNKLLGIVGPDGISKEEFVNEYTIVETSNNVSQFDEKFAKLANPVGVIKEITNDEETTTNVLSWTVTKDDMDVIYKNNDNHTLTVYVCYQKKVDPDMSTKYYLPLTFKVQKPEDLGKLTIGTKSVNYWMRDMTVAITNVKVPENGGTPVYRADLDDEWFHTVGGSQVPGPEFIVPSAITSAFPTIKNDTFSVENGLNGSGYVYYFKTPSDPTKVVVNGEEKTVEFSLNGETELRASVGGKAVETIAVLDQTTGVVEYQKNETSKALLNAFASFDSTDANPLDRNSAKLYAQIGVRAYWGCNISIPVDFDSWKAYFLRPINIAAVSPESFQDAKDNGSTLDVFNMLTFTDWRNQKFSDNPWYYAYYQVTKVSVDTDNILSNAANGEFAINTTINSCFKFDKGTEIDASTLEAYNSALKDQTDIINTWMAAFGKLTYKNDGTNTKDFKVRIPVKVSYYWGDIQVMVEADVKSTLLDKKSGRK